MQQTSKPHSLLVPFSLPKGGEQSVGVARQWCGRLGKVNNCQVAIYMGYVSAAEHALVDMRLYMPKEWTKNKARREKAGAPKNVRYRTRHQLCLKMLERHGDKLPHSWIAGDDEMGRPYAFRRRLDRLGERYLLAVPSNTLIRDLEADTPPYSGRGRHPKRPWQRTEARRGKKMDPRDYRTTSPRRHLRHPTPQARMRYALSNAARTPTTTEAQRTGAPVPLETA